MSNNQPTSIKSIQKYWQAANYITAVILHLRSNVLIEQPLVSEDFKHPILGHWGTCPGINAIYAHVSNLIQRSGIEARLIVGAGHAGPAILANLFLEGSLGRVYQEYQCNALGLQNLAQDFGTYEGLDTEICAEFPGMLYAGGELGTALAFAQGCSLNNPSKLTVCIIGDGELETSVTQGSWQGFGFLAKGRTNGPILPIINANGFRMGSRSLFSLKPEDEQVDYFLSHGLFPIVIDANHTLLAKAMSDALKMMPEKQPVIVFKSPKGWTAPLRMGGFEFVDSHRSHKPILRSPSSDKLQRLEIEKWLKSYRPKELFDDKGIPKKSVLQCLPEKDVRLGNGHKPDYHEKNNPILEPLNVGTSKKISTPIQSLVNCVTGSLKENKQFVVFSPDELSSNRFEGILEGDGDNLHVIEILNEHLCLAWAQGYSMTYRRCLIISYEAFAPLFDSMITQHLKFLDRSINTKWRIAPPSINIILTSLGWYNCPTHHNPGFIDTLVHRKLKHVRVFSPSSSISAVNAYQAMLESFSGYNVLVISKNQLPKLAKSEGGNVQFQSWSVLSGDTEGQVLLVGVGDCMVEECLEAKDIILSSFPELLVTVISVEEITAMNSHHHEFPSLMNLISAPISVVWAYIGYPSTIKSFLWDHQLQNRHVVLGYLDKANSIAGLPRFIENKASRFHIAANAVLGLGIEKYRFDVDELMKQD